MVKTLHFGVPWGALLVALTTTTAATAADVEVTARITPTEITVGDPVRYEITVTHPPGARVELPAVRGNTGALEVLDYSVRTDSTAASKRAVIHTLNLASYEVGRDTLPPQRVEVRIPPDTTTIVLYTPATFLTVTAVSPADAKDIAEIYDEEKLPRSWPWGIPLVLIAAYGLYRALRAWQKRRTLKPAPQPEVAEVVVTASEAALARLWHLRREGHIAAGRSRVFAFSLSEIVREYLAARFGIDALEATTAELLERTSRLSLSTTESDWLRHTCDELDTVKFADVELTLADEARLLDGTETFIRSTAEKPSTPVSPAQNQTTL